MKIAAIVLLIVTGFLLMAFLWYSRVAKDSQPVLDANYYEIDFPQLNERVYLRARSWGLAGNHQEIIIASAPITNKHLEYFEDRQIIYLDSVELYCKGEGDTLVIYVDSLSNIPTNFSSAIKVKQIELKSEHEQRYYASHYEELGLLRVSVYKTK